jgi:D-alanyl-D-alanine carboxypeptidase/D-alanyl-D-alanine-endopeptidase (penicillin-binding protein 4)
VARRSIPFALRIAALACIAGAAVLVVSARPPSDGTPLLATAPGLHTPLWSPRRVPALFIDRAARVAYTRLLAPALAPYNACIALDASSGPVARINADTTHAPASTLKLVTAATALARLGAGDLVLVGGGDPVLATDDYVAHEHAMPARRSAQYTALARLADAIVAAGVRDVRGAILVDDHAQDRTRFLPDWKPSYVSEGEVGALGALTVNGGFGDPLRQTPAADPAIETGLRLDALLAARHVRVARGVRRIGVGGGREIAHVDSPPLATIVGDMLRGSDNYTAEEVMRAVGTGSTRAGIAVALQTMQALGVPTAGATLHDGSGLAPDDRVSCSTLLAVLELSSEPRFAAIDRGLAVAGRTGTLATRFVGDPLAGRLRAKTGSIDNVVGLVGIIDAPTRMRFAFLASGPFTTLGGEQLQAEIAHLVAAPVPAPAPDRLVPLP